MITKNPPTGAGAPVDEARSASTIPRRAVVVGAAWSVPAIAVAVAAPAYAASGLTLAFDSSTYQGVGCGTISGVRITAANGGAATAGVAITVSLSGGYTVGGGSGFTGVTDANGVLTVPDISVPFAGGTATISATAAGSGSASATLIGTGATVGAYLQNGTEGIAFGVPTGSTPVAALIYLTSDDRLIFADGSLVASNVSTAGEIYYYPDLSAWFLPVKKTDGTFTWLQNGVENAAPAVPAGSTPVAAQIFLAPDGRLLFGDGSLIASNVASVGQFFAVSSASGSSWMLPVKKTDGSFAVLQDAVENDATGVPSGSAPVAAGMFLTGDARLIDAYGNLAAVDVRSFGGIYYDPGTSAWYLPLAKTDGSFTYLQSGFENAAPAVPAGSTPVSYDLYLTPDGHLVDHSGTVRGSNAAATGQIYYDPNSSAWYLPFVVNRSSC